MSYLNPATFLELVQRLSIEAGVTDDPPATLVSASGQLLTFMNHINEASLEIQRLHDDWGFMRVRPGVSFTTIADQMTYTPTETGISAGILTKWLTYTFRVYKTATGFPSEIPMTYYEYDDWRDQYEIGALRTSRVQPVAFSVVPGDLSIAISCPLAGYTITGEYIKSPVGLTVDADASIIPLQYRMAIVWKALMDYGTDESSPEVYAKGTTKYDSLIRKMETLRLPTISLAGPIA